MERQNVGLYGQRHFFCFHFISEYMQYINFVFLFLALNITAGIYFFKVSNGNTRTMSKICAELTIKTPEQRHWHRFGVFMVNLAQILHVLVFPLLTLNYKMPAGTCFPGMKSIKSKVSSSVRMDQGIPSYCVINVQSMENMIFVTYKANTCSKFKVNWGKCIIFFSCSHC